MKHANATLAACIVLVCLGIALINPGTSFILDVIVACLLLGGVIRPAYLTWIQWLNQPN